MLGSWNEGVARPLEARCSPYVLARQISSL